MLECVLIWGFTLSGKGGSQGGSQKGVHKGFTRGGGSREPCEPPGYGPAHPARHKTTYQQKRKDHTTGPEVVIYD